jgi:hypothetical protein
VFATDWKCGYSEREDDDDDDDEDEQTESFVSSEWIGFRNEILRQHGRSESVH